MNTLMDIALDSRALATLDDAVGADDAVTVMDLILGSVPALREQLRAAAASGNIRDLIRAAHQLRSECAYVGATILSARLQDIESRAGEGRLAQPDAEAAVVSAMIERFLELLRGVRNARAPAAQGA